MRSDSRQAAHIAALFCDELHRLRQRRLDELDAAAAEGLHALEVWQRLSHRMALARRRNWEAASARLAEQLRRQSTGITGQVETMARRLACVRLPETPGPRQVVDELQQLDEEFGQYTFDPARQTLSVTTEPIVLERIALGPFRIDLHLRDLAPRDGRGCYDVVALQPHPAAGNDSITHPHVSDERLCEGDAGCAIRAALEAGRLGDFFLIVASVLTTYNPQSPYVALDEWDGDPCADCGRRAHEEDRLFCHGCERDYCGECTGSCAQCDAARCLGCLRACRACREEICDRCLVLCAGCDAPVCGDCVEDDLCPTCHPTREEHHAPNTPPPPTPPNTPQGEGPEEACDDPQPARLGQSAARPAVHPHGLGQAPSPLPPR